MALLPPLPDKPGDHILHSPGDTHLGIDRRFWINDRGFLDLWTEAQSLQLAHNVVAGLRVRRSANRARLAGEGLNMPKGALGREFMAGRSPAESWEAAGIDTWPTRPGVREKEREKVQVEIILGSTVVRGFASKSALAAAAEAAALTTNASTLP